jgi:hypothetical protein
MARTIRDSRLETRAARARLDVGRKAYWKTLVPGAAAVHLGYRRRHSDRPGRWLVRRYVGRKHYRVAPLGIADDFDDAAMSFAEAQKAALATAADPKGAGALTVADAIESYVAWLEAERGGEIFRGGHGRPRTRRIDLQKIERGTLEEVGTNATDEGGV